ncbi:MAG: winged helix-turn-helix domain-containing protein [Hyphomonadaceae bacterium]
MIYAFDDFELDAQKIELRGNGAAIALEPQVFALLLLLVENQDRLVSRDEIIEKVWDGRIVSDSALSSRIKALRAALGDDGKAQRYIRTLHGRGFRFVGEARFAQALSASAVSVTAEPDAPLPQSARPRPSIAVLPFRLVGVAGDVASVADALPDEIIAVLARLRWLFVIARGSTFRFRPPHQDTREIGAALNVRYCLTGAIEIIGKRTTIAVELADTNDASVVWGDRFTTLLEDVHETRERIIAAIVAALELHIPRHEAAAARLISPDRLDAWSAYHLGLQHLYRFSGADNARALGLFEKAVALDPSFARAHAALSSAHFQNAFQRYGSHRDLDVLNARKHAERSVELDPVDPFANFAMGRVYWVENDILGGTAWLDRSVSLSPNYAQGVYARAWANSIAGGSDDVAEDAMLALSLSPLDPFRYGMIGVRAFAALTKGDTAAAARLGDEAARAPGAHALIAAIAAALHGIDGNEERARFWADNVRTRRSDMTAATFFEAFPFSDPAVRTKLAEALKHCGF